MNIFDNVRKLFVMTSLRKRREQRKR